MSLLDWPDIRPSQPITITSNIQYGRLTPSDVFSLRHKELVVTILEPVWSWCAQGAGGAGASPCVIVLVDGAERHPVVVGETIPKPSKKLLVRESKINYWLHIFYLSEQKK
jgi:hypothetical protein